MSTSQSSHRNLDDAPIGDSSSFGSSIPVIDLADNPGSAISDQVAQACAKWGFFQIVGHDVDSRLIQSVMDEARSFFSQPKDVKRGLLRTKENPWGFYDRELTKNVRDKKEIFDIGPSLVPHLASLDPFTGKTPWPASLPGFEQTMRRYFSECERVSARLMEIVSVGLAAPKNGLRKYFEPAHTSFLRLNYYPVADPMGESAEGADLGVHHHTDAGALTVLLQDDVKGLQVYRDGAWYGVTPLKGAFVVNIGDMIQVWSNDIYRAAVHRVLAMDRVDRYSFPFFFNPSYDAVVQPLDATVNHSRPSNYRGISWGEFRRKRADGDYANNGAEVQISDYRR